jgi:hypothetical protein
MPVNITAALSDILNNLEAAGWYISVEMKSRWLLIRHLA